MSLTDLEANPARRSRRCASRPAPYAGRPARYDPAGTAFLSTLFLMVTVSSISCAFLMMTESGLRMTRTAAGETQAYYAALAGLEEARGRLNATAPDAIGSSLLPQTVNDILYLVNGSEQDPVDPTSPSSPYCDRGYAKEFAGGLSAARLLGTAPSDQPGAGTAFSIPYKWVRVTLKTEYSSRQDVNRDGVLDNAVPVVWDGSSQDLATRMPTGIPVYKLTALAVLPSGIRKVVQVEITGASPLRPVGTLSTGSSGTLSGEPQTGSAPGPSQGQGQGLGQGLGPGQGLGQGLGQGGPPGSLTSIANLLVSGVDICGVQSISGVAAGGTITTTGLVTLEGTPSPTSERVSSFPYSAAELIAMWRNSAVPIRKVDPTHVALSPAGDSYLAADSVLGRAPTATQPAQPVIVYSDRPLTISGSTDEGAGILMVQGNLSITGGFRYHGLIVADGTVSLANSSSGGILIQGSVISSGDVSADSTASTLTNVSVNYDSCSLAEGFRALPKKVRVFRELYF